MANGEIVKPETEGEKQCFKILEDLDHIASHVKGSITNKKYMRNEIWSLVAFKGAPSWLITFSPADNKHPICLYYADKNVKFSPEIRSSAVRDLLVLQNPIAAARFFDMLVKMTIKHVFGVGVDHPGLYGKDICILWHSGTTRETHTSHAYVIVDRWRLKSSGYT